MKADRDVTEEDLRTRHLLLVGRPDSNAVVDRLRSALPVQFASRYPGVTVNGVYSGKLSNGGEAITLSRPKPL